MNIRCSALFFIAIIVGLTSCKNNDENFAPVVSTYFNVVNASTDTLNFYLNGTRQNNGSSLYPTGESLYITVPAGQQNYQFKKAGAFIDLFSVPLNLKDSTFYSLYVYGESASKTFTTTDALVQYVQSPDTTQIRFVNVSPDAGSLNVTVGDTLSFTGQAFKSSTAFGLIGGGSKEVKVTQVSSGTLLVDTTITFQPGSIYTLFSKGLLNGKGNAAFDVGVALNPAIFN
jgi:hypothetical protein